MNILKLLVIVFVVGLKAISCGSVGNIYHEDGDVKKRLLRLLSPTDLPGAIEDPTADFSKNNFVNAPNFVPSYKSKFKPGHNHGSSEEEYFQTPSGQNDKFAIPWLNFAEDENKEDSFQQGSDNTFLNGKEEESYEVKEEQEEPDYPTYNHHHHKHPAFYPGHNHGFGHRRGSYEGFGLHYHHNQDFHRQHEHTPDCFPFGNHRRPRPRPTARPSSTVPPSIDPRASTSAGIISTEVPGIDIRVGRDTGDEADRIVFPE